MKHLLLLRHAKSSWDNPSLRDFDRPLNDRGQKAAALMAQFLSENRPLPDYILCSSSQRTRETLSFLLGSYCHPIQIELNRFIYEASYLSILEAIHKVPAECETLMVVGHNPGMEDLALTLCTQGDAKTVDSIGFKYPTAACAHITFEEDSWHSIGRDKGFLKSFVRPKDLLTDDL